MPTLVLVDDDYTNTSLLKMVLEMEGFAVETYTGVQDALASMPADASAMVVDCNLTGDDEGLDIVRAIRAGRAVARTTMPIIVTSGDYRRHDEAMAAGANQFMLKPFGPSDLLQQLRRLLDQGEENGE